jgi:hypothetical protein
MKNLPQHIENQFFRVLNQEISIQDFEQWVYEMEELELVLSSDNYLDLIAFNFKQKDAFHELYNLLIELINFPKFEKYRIIYLLDLIIVKDNSWKKIVNILFHEYINSYAFLIVFSGIDDMLEYDKTYWVTVDADMYLASRDEAIRIKNHLNSGSIIIIGREGHRKATNYIDNRTEAEKKFY